MSTKQKLQDAQATYNVFLTLCSDSIVHSCVDKTTGHKKYRVIQCIVLRNILNGRVTRQWHSQNASDPQVWLQSYIRNVDSYYHTEHIRWLHLQSREGQLELYELLTQLAYRHPYRGHRCWPVIEEMEITHEAYIRTEERLRRYPFDLPLNSWLERHLCQCADRLRKDVYASSAAHGTLEYLPDLNQSADYHHWDIWIDLDRNIHRLSPENLAVLRLWLQGFTLEETSHQLDLTEKAVSNRRWRIQKRLCMP